MDNTWTKLSLIEKQFFLIISFQSKYHSIHSWDMRYKIYHRLWYLFTKITCYLKWFDNILYRRFFCCWILSRSTYGSVSWQLRTVPVTDYYDNSRQYHIARYELQDTNHLLNFLSVISSHVFSSFESTKLRLFVLQNCLRR